LIKGNYGGQQVFFPRRRTVMSSPDKPPPHGLTGFSDGAYGGETEALENLGGFKERFHRKSCTFTQNLAKFGPWTDTSLDAATRDKTRDTVVEMRRQKSMLRVNSSFMNEAKRVEKLQRALAKKQHKMAYTALEMWAAIKLQQAYRARVAYKVLRNKKRLRFIMEWLIFKIISRRRIKNANFIQHNMRVCLGRKRMARIVICASAARKISAFIRRVVAKILAQRVMELRRLTLRTVSIATSYGSYHITQQRVNAILNEIKAKCQIAFRKLGRLMMRKARRRKLRRRGKLAFQHLIFDVPRVHHEEMSSTGNYLLAYLKTKSLAKELAEMELRLGEKTGQYEVRRKSSAVAKSPTKKLGGSVRASFRGEVKQEPESLAPVALPFFLRGYYAPRDLLELFQLWFDITAVALERAVYLEGQSEEPISDDNVEVKKTGRRKSGKKGSGGAKAGDAKQHKQTNRGPPTGRKMSEPSKSPPAAKFGEDEEANEAARIASGLMETETSKLAAVPPSLPRPSMRGKNGGVGAKTGRKLVPPK